MPEEKLYYLGAKGLIQNVQGQILLLKIRKDEKTYFDLPGGRINKDESITEALAREIHEETGISSVSSLHLLGMAPTSIQIPIMAGVSGGLILAVYACKAVIPDVLQTELHMQVVWCEKEGIATKLMDYPSELRDVINRHLQ